MLLPERWAVQVQQKGLDAKLKPLLQPVELVHVGRAAVATAAAEWDKSKAAAFETGEEAQDVDKLVADLVGLAVAEAAKPQEKKPRQARAPREDDEASIKSLKLNFDVPKVDHP